MIKPILCAALILFGILGILVAGSENNYFPEINFLGLAVTMFCAWGYLKIKDIVF